MVDDAFLSHFFNALDLGGTLIQQSGSFFHCEALKSAAGQINAAGFGELQVLNFPQPSFSSGWRSALMAPKENRFKRVREKDIYNRLFKTVYYNFDVHKASLVLPEFLRTEWIPT